MKTETMSNAEYVENRGEVCPCCGGHSVSRDTFVQGNITGVVTRDCVCLSCDSIWKESYELSRYSFIE